MPTYQNSSVSKEKLIIGNCKIETAASATSSTWTNLGVGMVSNFQHNITKYDVQAGNGPDPIEGIADENVTIDAELIEYDSSVLAVISCGATTSATGGSGVTVLSAGGNQSLTERAFRLTNTRSYNSTTVTTVMLVKYATLSNGVGLTFKGDNDTDPIGIMPIQVVGKNDTNLTAGSQLYTITHTYNPA